MLKRRMSSPNTTDEANSTKTALLPKLGPLDLYLAKERSDRRVLSIQSHVVSGFVGNKCAVFPLQLHGFEVDSINSVQFSNHTQYTNGVRGQRLDQQDLKQLFEGLRLNKLERNYSHVLTGYCGDASFLRKIASIVRECRQHRPNLLYFCDPVLGDNGKYYVPKELRDIFLQELLPLADVITPNAFELGELAGGRAVNNEKQCLQAMAELHAAAPNLRSVVCTSGLEPVPNPQGPPTMHCYASEKRRQQIGGGGDEPQFRVYRFDMPKIEGTFVGSGDLFAALLLAWMDETGQQLCAAVRATIASMQAVLRRTVDQTENAPSTCVSPELRLVQSRLDLLRPNAEQIEFVELQADELIRCRRYNQMQKK